MYLSVWSVGQGVVLSCFVLNFCTSTSTYTCSRCNPKTLPNCLLMRHVDCNLQIDFRISRIVSYRQAKRSSFTNFFSLRTIYANSYQGLSYCCQKGSKPWLQSAKLSALQLNFPIAVVNRRFCPAISPEPERELEGALLAVLEPTDVAKDPEVQK